MPLMVLLACVGVRVGYAQPTYDADPEAKLIALEQVEKVQASALRAASG
ncbi:MAG TPA: hypothetical protein VNX60_10525 [Candidatus Acidoferrum sp.]|nr:hypothetical protein [Candidatus Acidoferrum sp.]